MANIKDIEAARKQEDEVVEVPIYDRAGEPYTAKGGEQATIGVVGKESTEYRKAEARRTRALLKARRAQRTEQDVLNGRIDLAGACVKRWSGWEDGGKEWPCTPENVAELLTVPHILEQIEDAIEGHQRFFRSASGT